MIVDSMMKRLMSGRGRAALVSGIMLLPVMVSAGEVEEVLIPAGEFVMGSDKLDTEKKSGEFGNSKPWYLDEHPRHKENLKAYHIDKYEVTNGEYREYVDSKRIRPPGYWLETGYLLVLRMEKVRSRSVDSLRKLASKVMKLDVDTRTMDKGQLLAAMEKRFAYMDKLPVVDVSWIDADAYCRFRGKRLPSEAEWEKAARGVGGQEFPWGDTWKAGMANAGEEFWEDGVAPVGSYKSDRSPYGVYDLGGNVSEWVNDWYQAYPGSDYQSKEFGRMFKVMRGAGWGREGHYAISLFQRGAYRFFLRQDSSHADLGFRCARDS